MSAFSSSSSSSTIDFDAAYKAKELAAKTLAEHKSLDSYSPSGKDESPTLSPVSTPSPTAEMLNAATRDEIATMRVMMTEMMKRMEEMEAKEVAPAPAAATTNATPSRPCHQSTVPFILGIGTAVPGIGRSQMNLVEGIITDFQLTGKTAALVRKIGKTSLVDWRYVTNPDRPAASTQHFETINAEFEKEAPKLALRASQEAIRDWGGDKNEITHVIGITCTGVLVPGIEFHVMRALDLPLSTQRLSIQFMGCFGCISGLKAAKAIAAEDPRHRVLVVCCELSTLHRQKSEATTPSIDALVATLIFGDGVGAFIAGSNPRPNERPLYEIHKSISYIIPDTVELMKWDLSESGMVIRLAKEIPDKIYTNIEGFAKALFKETPCEGTKYDSHYWAIHPGGPMIVQSITDELQLDPSKADASYEVLRKYGNMSSATLVFVMNEMRKLYPKHKAGYTTSGGKVYGPTSSWIPAVAFGPGLNVEGCLLRWTGNREAPQQQVKQDSAYLSTVMNHNIKDADEETKAAWSIM